jgi:ribosomal protein S12 methylthiotransferase accessory factor
VIAMGSLPGAERSLSPEEALVRFDVECRKSRVDARIDSVGARLRTYRCRLFDEGGRYLTQGFGKGIGAQAKASACFESLEHLWAFDEPASADAHQRSVDDIAASARGRHLVPSALRNDACRGVPLAWLPVESLQARGRVYVPRVLVDPQYVRRPSPGDAFDYGRLSLTLTSTGQAIGANEDEAVLHSLCERIERDSVACLLLETFASETPAPIRAIDRETLPRALAALCESVEEELRDELLVLDATTDLGVPTYFATLRRRQALARGGAGASLFPEHAFARAVLEALQSAHGFVFDGPDGAVETLSEVAEIKRRVQRRFARWPALSRVATMDFFDVLDRGHVHRVPFRGSDGAERMSPAGDVSALVRDVVDRLEAHGVPCLRFVQRRSVETGITSVATLAVGLEDLSALEYGHFVVPGPRGQARTSTGRTRRAPVPVFSWMGACA